MLSDFRPTFRTLAKARGFALIAVLTLGVGIGAATVIFSALRALVIDPFQYPRSDQLVHVWSGDRWPFSPADYFDIREQSTSFSSFGLYQPHTFNVGNENAQSILGTRTTSDVLRAFGVPPLLGRTFTADDEAQGAARVVILSHALWQQRFGGDPGVIGRKLWVDGSEAEIVGVMPRSFEFVSPWLRTVTCELWAPLSLEEMRTMRDNHFLLGLARLREGVSIATADAEVKTIGKRLSELYPDSNTRKEFLVRSLHFEMTRDIRGQVWTLFAAVTLMLLVACGNIASMLLARSVRRQGEFGVRVALGATPSHLVRITLAESLVLAFGGAAVGLALALGGLEVIRVITPLSEARKAAISLDGMALLFAFGATLLTALLAGLPPALAARRTSIAGVIRSDARGAVGSQSQHRMLRGLVIAQVALAFVLANGAVLFSQSYLKLVEDNQLISTDNVITVQIALHSERYKEEADRVRFWYELAERMRALPGVAEAAVSSKVPLEGGSNTHVLFNDERYDPTQPRTLVERTSATEGYHPAMGLRLLKGRLLQPEDRQGDIRGVLVNRTLVAKAWPNQEPLGELIRGNNPGEPWFKARVVGVVEDVRQWGPDQEPQPEMYFTPEGHWGRNAFLIVRSELPIEQLAPLLRRELAAIDSQLAFRDLRTMRQVVRESTQGQRVIAGLINFFMITALGLVAVGLYGTLSYHVQRRTREIGVRVAIGADRRKILRLVLGQGGRWVGIGLAIGLAGSLALSSAVRAIAYGVESVELGPLTLAALAVGVAATVACWLPAQRAARLDPLDALRAD